MRQSKVDAEQELRKKLNLYREVFARSNDAIGILDAQGVYLEQNEVHRRLIGYSDEDLEGRTPAIHFGAEAFDRVAAILAETGEFRGELTSTTKSGRRRRIQLTAFALRDDAGEPICYVGIKRDVTAQWEAEEEARQRHVHEALLNNLITTHRSRPMDEELSSLVKDILLAPWLDLAPHGGVYLEDQADATRLRLAAACNLTDVSATVKRGTCPACGQTSGLAHHSTSLTPDQQPALGPPHLHVPIELGGEQLGSLLVFSRGDPTGTQAELLREVAGALATRVVRQRAEDALRESETRFKEICSSIPGVVFQLEQRAEGGYGFSFVSDGISTLYNVSPLQAQDDVNAVFGRIHPDDRPQVDESLSRSARTLATWDAEYRVQLPNGELRWHQATSSPRRLASGATLWSGVVLDVSKRRRAQDELRQAKDAAEAATRAKSRFLANVSHEIRTPLNAVIGMTSLLVETPPMTPEQEEYASTIRSSAETLLALINDLLDVSRLESRKMELEQHPFDLVECLEGALDLVACDASEKGLALSYSIEGETPTRVIGDITRLRQVLVNLLSNAVKFTEVGTVGVTLQSRPLPTHRAELRVRVRDTGRGIPAANMSYLFEPFSQGDPSIAREFGGTGLGLAISKRLSELMGGTLSAESEEGLGSTFTFTCVVELPPGPNTKNAAPGRSPNSAPGSSCRRVLLVEDHPVNQKVTLSMLTRLGYPADVVCDGEQALEALERADYDLVLMDIQMPRMNGLETTRRIRERKVSLPRIVAMTATVTPEDRRACLEAGVDEYLGKPMQVSDLRALIERLFDAPATRPSIDPKVLETLRDVRGSEGGPNLAEELVEVFLEDTPVMIRELRGAVEAGDSELVRDRAHALKGSAVNLGAGPLADMADALETAGRTRQLDGAPAFQDELEVEFDRLKIELRRLRIG